ncbi:multicopper oxidase domain-containing protein [Micrococcales bacterium 31B]|nr:multicopper oxidase domain-containing protein [Micrococcales bacterium 31B]
MTFANPLRIPPLDEGTIQAGVRAFDLTLQAGTTALVPQGATPTWGVNGTILGPTLRVRRGERVRLAVNNSLPEATTLHWHGMRLPARADGGPHHMIEPGATWETTWTVDQPAATLWYHPHPHGQTELHTLREIGGLLLVDDVETVAAHLPDEYGVDDIPEILQDRTFDDAGAFVETERIDVGMLGDTMLGNGTVGPYLEVTATLTRLRVLNASAARTYTLCLADNRPFTLIATDGGLVPAPVPLTRLMLSPGERADIVVEMSAGERLSLRSTAQDLGVSARLAERMGGADELDLLELRAAASLRDSPALPPVLGTTGGLDARVPASQRTFDLGDNRINNQNYGRESHRPARRGGHGGGVERREQSHPSPQFSRARRAVSRARSRRKTAPARARGLEGHDLHSPRRHAAPRDAVRPQRRRRGALHVPLPPAVARRPGHDGSVSGRRESRAGEPRARNRARNRARGGWGWGREGHTALYTGASPRRRVGRAASLAAHT